MVETEEILKVCEQAAGIEVPLYVTVKLTFVAWAGMVILFSGSKTKEELQLVVVINAKVVGLDTSS